MERLLKWLSDFNSTDYNPDAFNHTLTEPDLDFLGDCYRRTLVNLFIQRKNKSDNTNYPIRPSMLGKPAMVIAYNYYHPEMNHHLPNNITRLTNIGYYFELWMLAQVIRLGYKVEVDLEKVIKVEGIDIVCHIDILVTDDKGNELIIECKEMSDWYYKSWIEYDKAQDDRGYLTQASLYSTAFGISLIWGMGNRTTGNLGLKTLDESTRVSCMARVSRILDVLVNKTTCWEECFRYMRPEPPNETKKGLTVPFGMKPIADIVYVLDKYGYVLDYKYPEGYEEYKLEL